MRVLYLHHLPFPWGRAHDVHVIKTVYYLAASGIPTTLLAPLKRPYRNPEILLKHYGLKAPPQNLFFVPLPAFRLLRPFKLTVNRVYEWAARLYFHRHPPGAEDLFLFSEPKLAPMLRKLSPQNPRVLEIHGLRYFKTGSPLAEEKEALEGVSLGLVTTRALRDLIQKVYAPRVHLEHLPLASEVITEKPYAGRNDPPLLIYSGQVYPGQGVETLLEALARVPGVHLVVVGGREKDRARLQDLSRKLRISERIRFTGHLPPSEVRAWLVRADILVLPAEATGKHPFVAHQKLYEYFGAGRPILASDLPSIREEVRKEEALLFRPGDAEDLAQKIRTILRDQELARTLARRALLRAEEFDWPARTRKMLEILEGYFHG